MFFIQKARTRGVEPVHENAMQSTCCALPQVGRGLVFAKSILITVLFRSAVGVVIDCAWWINRCLIVFCSKNMRNSVFKMRLHISASSFVSKMQQNRLYCILFDVKCLSWCLSILSLWIWICIQLWSLWFCSYTQLWNICGRRCCSVVSLHLLLSKLSSLESHRCVSRLLSQVMRSRRCFQVPAAAPCVEPGSSSPALQREDAGTLQGGGPLRRWLCRPSSVPASDVHHQRQRAFDSADWCLNGWNEPQEDFMSVQLRFLPWRGWMLFLNQADFLTSSPPSCLSG